MRSDFILILDFSKHFIYFLLDFLVLPLNLQLFIKNQEDILA